MIRMHRQGGQYIVYDDAWLDAPHANIFSRRYWESKRGLVGTASGRGEVCFIRLQQGEAALRHYRRGGWMARWMRDAYWFTGWSKTRSVQEFETLMYLRRCCLNVPVPIAAYVNRHGWLYRADLLTQRISGAQSLTSLLLVSALPDTIYQAIGEQIARLHAAQVTHPDLNLNNILIDGEQRVWLIDFDKCRKRKGSGWKKKNLDRLWRSFNKEQRLQEIHWQHGHFDTLLAGYKEALAVQLSTFSNCSS